MPHEVTPTAAPVLPAPPVPCPCWNWSTYGSASVKRRPRTVAVSGVNLQIAKSEFVTLVGPSGCGKSTLFNMIAGLLPPDERRLAAVRRRAAARRATARQGVVHAAARPALSVAHRARQRHPRARGGRRAAQGSARTGARHAARVRPHGFRRPLSAPALGRHAPARRADAHLSVRARPDAARRALRRARRADAHRACSTGCSSSGPGTAARCCSSPTTSTKPSCWATRCW